MVLLHLLFLHLAQEGKKALLVAKLSCFFHCFHICKSVPVAGLSHSTNSVAKLGVASSIWGWLGLNKSQAVLVSTEIDPSAEYFGIIADDESILSLVFLIKLS